MTVTLPFETNVEDFTWQKRHDVLTEDLIIVILRKIVLETVVFSGDYGYINGRDLRSGTVRRVY